MDIECSSFEMVFFAHRNYPTPTTNKKYVYSNPKKYSALGFRSVFRLAGARSTAIAVADGNVMEGDYYPHRDDRVVDLRRPCRFAGFPYCATRVAIWTNVSYRARQTAALSQRRCDEYVDRRAFNSRKLDPVDLDDDDLL